MCIDGDTCEGERPLPQDGEERAHGPDGLGVDLLRHGERLHERRRIAEGGLAPVADEGARVDVVGREDIDGLPGEMVDGRRELLLPHQAQSICKDAVFDGELLVVLGEEIVRDVLFDTVVLRMLREDRQPGQEDIVQDVIARAHFLHIVDEDLAAEIAVLRHDVRAADLFRYHVVERRLLLGDGGDAEVV